MENNLFSLGFHEHSPQISTDDPVIHCALAQAKAVESQADVLVRLSLYEQRLNRTLVQAKAELKQLQDQRRQAEEQALRAASRICKLKENLGQPWEPRDDGFEFSSGQLSAWTHRTQLKEQADDFHFHRLPSPASEPLAPRPRQ
jgi:hypothetical protein